MTLRSKTKRSGSTAVRTVAAIQDVLRYLPGDTLVVTCDDQYVTLEVINGVLVVSDEETPNQMPWEYQYSEPHKVGMDTPTAENDPVGRFRKDKSDV